MMSTSLSKDLYKTFINPSADGSRLMSVARLSAIACGVVAAILGMILPTVITALKIFYTLLSAALLLPLVVGLYGRRVNARSMIASIVTSVALTFALEIITKGQGFFGVPSLIFGVAAGAAMLVSLTLFERPKREALTAS
jgi:SSS family solute:Na+ symporter